MMTFSVHVTQCDKNNIANYKKYYGFIIFTLTSRLFAALDLRLGLLSEDVDGRFTEEFC